MENLRFLGEGRQLSHGGKTAVDRNGGSVNERGLIGGKKQNGCRDVAGSAKSPGRIEGFQFRRDFRTRFVVNPRAFAQYGAGADSIDAYAGPAVLRREHSSKRDDAAFRCRISSKMDAGKGVHRADVDNRA